MAERGRSSLTGEEEGRDQQLDEDVHDGDGAGDGGGERGGRRHLLYRRYPQFGGFISLGSEGSLYGPTTCPSLRGSWRIGRPHLICSKTKQAEEEGDNPGRRSRGGWRSWDGEERGRVKIWIIQHYFYQSHRFFPVNLKVEVETSLLPLSLFHSCNSIILTDIRINQGLYTT